MSKYTIELGKLIEKGYPLRLRHYPIFNEEYRTVLNQKIVNHFYFREIGAETPDRFNFYLERTLFEIMPYYNQLYASELIRFDPLASFAYEETSRNGREHTNTIDSKGTQTERGTEGDVFTRTNDDKNIFDSSLKNEQIGHGEYRKMGENHEALHEEITSNTLTTNDLETENDTENNGEGTSDTNGSKSSVFSDIPQAGIESSVIVHPDGSTEYQTNGYATTTTNENTVEHNETTTHETGHSVTTNTGTVNVDGKSDRQQTTNTNWTENGDNDNTVNFSETQNQNTYGLTKEDTERNIARNNDSWYNRNEENKFFENIQANILRSGRQGTSPSQLLNEFRSTFLNIDMLILGELEKLFMEVY